MTTEHTNFKIIKCRGIIIHNDKILVVKHSLNHKFYALPGGHLEGEENPKECVEREIYEEFGIKAEIGRLLYVYQFNDNGKSYLEFFFEIINVVDFEDLDENKLDRNEVIDVIWAPKDNDVNILPVRLSEDFKNGFVLHDEVIFIKD